MGSLLSLTPEQQQFLARACAFIDQGPTQQELDQLLTLAAMLLPEPVTEMLAQRASNARIGVFDSDSPSAPWLQ